MKKMSNGISPGVTVGTSRNVINVRGEICGSRENSSRNENVEITQRNESFSLQGKDGGVTYLPNTIVYNNNPLHISDIEDEYMVEKGE